MNTSVSSVVVYVTYHGTSQDRFDRDYYITAHLPLVIRAWSQYGLLGVTAFFPAPAQEGTVALCECIFRDECAVEAAFASPEASAVMADVLRYTALAPRRLRAVAF